MRVLLGLALVLHLSGIPAVVASPCAQTPGAAHACCMKHATESGGDVIGRCGCQAAPGPAGDPVSVAPPSLDPLHVAGPIALPVTFASPAAAFSLGSPAASTVPADQSPPPLSGTGFRC